MEKETTLILDVLEDKDRRTLHEIKGKYYVHGKNFLGGGYLSILDNGKSYWSNKIQIFSKEEVDTILDRIGTEWTWKCMECSTHEVYREHEAHYVYI